MSNSLDSDQARHFVGPGLSPKCFQRLSADDHIYFKINKFFERKIVNISYPSVLTYVLGAQKNRLNDTILLSTHNICFV